MAIARDKFWLFGVKAHQDDIWLMPDWRTEKVTYSSRSRITPAEGAFILDIPNILMIQCDGVPAPFSKDALGQAVGRTALALAAFTDPALALAFVKALGQPDRYKTELESLDRRAKRIQQRQKEAKAHEKNVRTGKKK